MSFSGLLYQMSSLKNVQLGSMIMKRSETDISRALRDVCARKVPEKQVTEEVV